MTAKTETVEELRERELNVDSAPSSNALTRNSQDAGLRYRKRSLWIVGFYLPLLIIPWILTCVMMHRPVMLPSYISQKGAYSVTQLRQHENWRSAVDVLSRIAAVVGIPAVSAVLAHGAVVYAQRRKENQSLSIRQLFPLADRGWIDPATLWHAFWHNKGPSTSTKYLMLGGLLIFITAVQPPIQSIVVTEEPKLLVTCNDDPSRMNNKDDSCIWTGTNQKIIGYDPEPQTLERAPQDYVVHRTLQNIIAVGETDIQTRLWREDPSDPADRTDTQRQAFRWVYDPVLGVSDEDKATHGLYYVSSILNGSNTGVLREHAARMDSRAKCRRENSFPEECAGDNPFEYEYKSNMSEVRICAEGTVNKFPFTRSRNKQEIKERIWFDLLWSDDDELRGGYSLKKENYTMSCEVTSRRGWFELGNYQNAFEPSAMLEQWPSPEEMGENFNDHASVSSGNLLYPVEEEEPAYSYGENIVEYLPNSFGSSSHVTSGPLMMAALALFGNTTFFHTAANTTEENRIRAANDVCQSGRIPFYVYANEYGPGKDIVMTCSESALASYEQDEDDDADRGDDLMSKLVGVFMQTMQDASYAQQILEVTMFFANEALLSGTAQTEADVYSRNIYSAPGYQVLKPRKTLGGIIAISILIALQALGLLLLLRFIYSLPTWTGSFDADALVQIAGQLLEQDQDVDIASASGLVGVVAHGAVPKTMKDGEDSEGSGALGNRSQGPYLAKGGSQRADQSLIPLALGAPGAITKRMHRTKPLGGQAFGADTA